MRYRPELEPATHMPTFVRAYNAATGVANTDDSGYHDTITQASLRAARDVYARHAHCVPVYEVANGLMRSPLGRSDWLLAYWSKGLLFSADARRGWIDPDLQPLPF